MAAYEVDLKELLEAGCHFGHQSRRWNPKMKKFIYTERDGVHIFDLTKTGTLLEEAMNFVHDSVRAGKEVVFIGAKRQAKAIVREAAMKVGAPFVTERWLGGMLTNWEEMERRLKKLARLKQQRDNGELSRYTKREQTMIHKDIERLERFFGGISGLTKRPEILFIVDSHREDTAVLEANKVGSKVIGIVDSNADPFMIDFPIPANDDAVRSIKLIVEKIAAAYEDGKTLRAKENPAPVKPAAPAPVVLKPQMPARPMNAPAANQPKPAVVAPVAKTNDAPNGASKPKKVLKPTDTKKKAAKKKPVPTKKK